MLNRSDSDSEKRSDQRVEPCVVEGVEEAGFVACVVIEGKDEPCADICAQSKTANPIVS